MNDSVYLGLGAGLFDDEYLEAAKKAIESLGLRIVRARGLPFKDAEPTSDDEIRQQMAASAARFLPMRFPDCAFLDDAHQRRLAAFYKRELEIALALRDATQGNHVLLDSPRSREARASVRVFLPTEGAAARQLRSPGARDVVQQVTALAKQNALPRDVFRDANELQLRLMSATLRAMPYTAKLTVMVSSSYFELVPERELIVQTLKMLGQGRVETLSFENDGEGREKLTESLSYVQRAAVYLGILYARYGTPVDDAGNSLTEIEYECARRLGKSRFFLIGDPNRYTTELALKFLANQVASDRDRLTDLKSRVRANEVFQEYENPVTEIPPKLLEMLSWMARPSIDQRAMPVTKRYPHPYDAHPYALLDDEALIARVGWKRNLEAWLRDPAGSKVLVLEALGGMGKSALAWSWVSDLKGTQQRPGIVWWSFYARDAHMDSLAAKLLEWLSDETSEGETLTTRDLMTKVLERLTAFAGQYLFVLDGVERELRFYRDFEAAKQTEGADLDQLLTAQVRFRARELGGESNARRAMLTFHQDGTVPSPDDASDAAWFLAELARVPGVRILVTTRFCPTALFDQASRDSSLVQVRKVAGLDASEVEALWRSKGLAWEDAPLPTELGGFSLVELCTDVLGGYALPIVLLAELVRSASAAQGSFREWKAALPEWLRIDDWRTASADGKIAAQERAADTILHLCFDNLDRTKAGTDATAESWVLDEILKHSTPVSHADLMNSVVDPAGPVRTQHRLLEVLNALRRRKIIGCNREQWVYEIHPRMRSAARSSTPDESPVLARWEAELRARWKAEQHGLGLVPEQVVGRRFDQITQLIQAGAARRACALFDAGIEPLLRYRATGGVVALRQAALEELLATVSRLEQRRVFTADQQARAKIRELYRPLRLSLEGKLADNECLAGRTSAAARRLKALGLAGAITNEPEGYARRKLAAIALGAADWDTAETSLLECLDAAARLGFADELRWTACMLVGLWIGQGRLGYSERVLERLRRAFARNGLDADIESVGVTLARARGSGLREALDRYRQSCTGRLALGSVYSELAELEAEVTDQLPGSSDAPIEQRLGDARLRATSFGFDQAAFDVEVLAAQHLLRTEDVGAAVSRIEALETDPRLDGLVAERARLRLHRAQGLARLGRPEAAAAVADTAFELVHYDSATCGSRSMFARWDRLLRDLGFAKRLDRAPRRPDEGEPPAAIREPETPDAPKGGTDTGGWGSDEILQLEAAKADLEWPKTTGSARKWWLAFENENRHRMRVVLQLAERLRQRRATVTEFFLAYVYSNTDDILANLDYLDYVRLKRAEEESRREARAAAAKAQAATLAAAPDPEPAPVQPPTEPEQPLGAAAPPAETSGRLELLRQKLGWSNTVGAARTWWERLEIGYAQRLPRLVALMEEIARRDATIEQFFQAYTLANVENAQAVLHYFDYDRRKRDEQARKSERRRAQAAEASES